MTQICRKVRQDILEPKWIFTPQNSTSNSSKPGASTAWFYGHLTAINPPDPEMPATLQQRVIQIIEMVPQKYWIPILKYAVTTSWPILKRMQLNYAARYSRSALRRRRARIALANPNNQRRRFRTQETESEVWEIPREEFEQAMFGGHSPKWKARCH